jgi:hypothetical protein
MKKLILYIFLYFTLFTTPSYAQSVIRSQVTRPQTPDSADIAYYSKKNGWLAAAQIIGFNVGIWTFDRLVLNTEYSKISLSSMKENLTHGFVWDNDKMATNMFAHPYHGSLYYNAARSNGFNFWGSAAFTLGGSLLWEFFGENEYPSINDIIATPVGGVILGEVLYRTSDLLYDDRTSGMERFVREALGFIVSPARGLTRIFRGDAWRKRPSEGRQFGMPDMSWEILLGFRALEFVKPILDKGVGMVLYTCFEYGDKFDMDARKPYDYFNIKMSLNLQKAQPLLGQINVLGRLWAENIVDKGKHVIDMGFYQHLDYYDSNEISAVSSEVPYRFCTPASFGVGFLHHLKERRKISFDSYLHLNIIALGGALSDHYRVDARDYNLAAGFSSKAGVNFSYKDLFSASLSYDVYSMFTWESYPDPAVEEIDWANLDERNFNYQGDRSSAILHAITLRTDLKLTRKLYLTGMFYLYDRRTDYKFYDNVHSQSHEGRLMITYKF